MTKRDYEVIAEIIAEMNWGGEQASDMIYNIARVFADKLKRDNHKFDKKVFLDYIKERM
jgi:hypothetical protein